MPNDRERWRLTVKATRGPPPLADRLAVLADDLSPWLEVGEPGPDGCAGLHLTATAVQARRLLKKLLRVYGLACVRVEGD